MTFGQVLARGVCATNRSITALILLFLLYGTFQGSSLVMGGLMTADMFTPRPGQPPAPELGLLMGFGCLSCFWMLVMVFGGPWVTGGAVGQLRDRVERPEDAPGSFVGYGGRFYLQLLVLTLVFVVVVFVMNLIIGLATLAILFDELGGFPMQPQQAQALQTHPLSISFNILGGLFLAALTAVFHLANAIIVIEYMDAFTALGQAFRFVRRRFGDAGKLWGVTVFLLLIYLGLSWTVPLGGIRNPPLLLVLGTVAALFFPYALLLTLAWAVSLWLARRESPDKDGDVNGETGGNGTVETPDHPIGEFDV